MKRNYILTAAVLMIGLALVAFTQKNSDGDLVKVSVVHHSGTKVLVLDTVFDPATGYSVEQFLLDNGLNPETTDIINTDELEGAHVHNIQEDVWYMNGASDGHVIKKQIRMGDGNMSDEDIVILKEKLAAEGAEGEQMEVKIMKTVDDEGNVSMKKFVNGEEVEIDETTGDNIWIDQEGNSFGVDSENVFIHEEGSGDKKVMVVKTMEHGDKEPQIVIKKVGDGEGSMSDEELQEMIQKVKEEHNIQDGQETVIMLKQGEGGEDVEMEMEVEVEKIIDEEGEHINMWINGEEVDPADHSEYLEINEDGGNIEIIIEDIEGGEGEQEVEIIKEKVIMIDGDCDEGMMEFLHQHEYTLAIVSTVSEGSNKSAEAPVAKEPTNIRELNFFPNPTTGEFRLSFNIPKRGKTQIDIFDINGKVVHSEDLGKFQGEYSGNINISDAGPGTYILSVSQGKFKLVEKVIVQ